MRESEWATAVLSSLVLIYPRLHVVCAPYVSFAALQLKHVDPTPWRRDASLEVFLRKTGHYLELVSEHAYTLTARQAGEIGKNGYNYAFSESSANASLPFVHTLEDWI